MANVRVRSPKERASSPKILFNRMSDYVTENAKSGFTAKDIAEEKSNQNKAAKEFGMSKSKTIKVNSNPKPGKTTISSMANVRGRILGGGLGGIFGVKNR